MPLLSLPNLWIIVIDIVAWAFFHLSISVVCIRIPLSYFLRESAWFRLFAWEKSGKRWQQLFLVKKWKGRLVDGTTILKKGYGKKRLHGTGMRDLKVFAAETKRAELTHWLSMAPAPLFFIWNPIWVGWVWSYTQRCSTCRLSLCSDTIADVSVPYYVGMNNRGTEAFDE